MFKGGKTLNKYKLILIICSCVCAILVSAVVVVAFTYEKPVHCHILGDGRVYHICNDGVYYTQQCQDGCVVKEFSDATFKEIFVGGALVEKIILEDNIVITEEFAFNAFVNPVDDSVGEPLNLDLDINLDLNGFEISTDIDVVEYDAMFRFNANMGSVNLNIYNGSLTSYDTSYIFRFKNNSQSGQNINITLNNVNCETVGTKTTPLFLSECHNICLNASNSRFVSRTTGNDGGDYGVGAFIDASGDIEFNNCYFEGGDAVYVKSGNVNLNSCVLTNEGLADHSVQGSETGFSAIGACLTADSHTTSLGTSVFIINIVDCQMVSNHSSKMICIKETIAEEGLEKSVSDSSIITIESCIFDENPMAGNIVKYDNVVYPNGIPQNDGGQIWVCGAQVID
jgi:hypothetical protein